MTFDELRTAAFILGDLADISRKLHRIDEADCNGDPGESGREKREQRLESKARDLADRLGVAFYHQGNPRGCSVYLVPADWDRARVLSSYSSGLAVIPRR
jgi:hypothetical protein